MYIDKEDKRIIEFLYAIDRILSKLSRIEALDEIDCVIMTKERYSALVNTSNMSYSDITHGI